MKICCIVYAILLITPVVDPGKMRVADWCQVMDKCLEMDLPWLMLRSKLVKCADDGMILYNTLFEEMTVQFKNSDVC